MTAEQYREAHALIEFRYYARLADLCAILERNLHGYEWRPYITQVAAMTPCGKQIQSDFESEADALDAVWSAQYFASLKEA